jgi:hypothetical protein
MHVFHKIKLKLHIQNVLFTGTDMGEKKGRLRLRWMDVEMDLRNIGGE